MNVDELKASLQAAVNSLEAFDGDTEVAGVVLEKAGGFFMRVPRVRTVGVAVLSDMGGTATLTIDIR